MEFLKRLPVLLLIWLAVSAGMGLVLAISDGIGLTAQAWMAYAILTATSLFLIFVIWRFVEGDEAPAWLFAAALLALLLRLGVGVALYRALPQYGYGEKAEDAGYVYWDAYKRDGDAYGRGRGDSPLVSAFTDPKRSDQYGGLLFISAGIYRYLGGEEHRPLLPVTLLAGISSMAVILSWGIGKRLFNLSVAKGSAWITVLYPEAILLGASQMREPFLITAFAASVYGYFLLRDGERLKGFSWILISIAVLTLPVSPAFVAVILITLLLTWLWDYRKLSGRAGLIIALALMTLLVAAYFATRAWSALEAIEGTPLQIIRAWLGNAVAGWRVTRVTEQSVWLDTLLTDTPDALQLPFLVIFGVVQPFLPAALVAPGSILWKSIAIWRSLGWFMILPLLVYATYASIRRLGWRHIGTFLALFVWVTALGASYRAPSYQWDNPRYRAAFLAIQAVVVAWAWWHGRESKDPWLRHISLIFGVDTLVFTYWYLGRYTALPKLAFLHNLLLIAIFTVGYLAYLVVIPKVRSRNIEYQD
jgi:hypothetical protein